MKENIVGYTGIYKDNFGIQTIIVENDFKKLSLEIGDVKFSGTEFSDLSIIGKSNYSDTQLARFTLFPKVTDKGVVIEETLCNCSFEVVIPQIIIDRTTNDEFYSDLKIEFSLGNIRPQADGGIEFENVEIALIINEKCYQGVGDVIEIAFDQIRKQVETKYQFKNCYGCMYGDYSVYGQSSFGTMLCFANQKNSYMAITTKKEYMQLANPDKQVQEIYCCGEYEIRKNGIGYRG